jgi:hypothetical protein
VQQQQCGQDAATCYCLAETLHIPFPLQLGDASGDFAAAVDRKNGAARRVKQLRCCSGPEQRFAECHSEGTLWQQAMQW